MDPKFLRALFFILISFGLFACGSSSEEAAKVDDPEEFIGENAVAIRAAEIPEDNPTPNFDILSAGEKVNRLSEDLDMIIDVRDLESNLSDKNQKNLSEDQLAQIHETLNLIDRLRTVIRNNATAIDNGTAIAEIYLFDEKDATHAFASMRPYGAFVDLPYSASRDSKKIYLGKEAMLEAKVWNELEAKFGERREGMEVYRFEALPINTKLESRLSAAKKISTRLQAMMNSFSKDWEWPSSINLIYGSKPEIQVQGGVNGQGPEVFEDQGINIRLDPSMAEDDMRKFFEDVLLGTSTYVDLNRAVTRINSSGWLKLHNADEYYQAAEWMTSSDFLSLVVRMEKVAPQLMDLAYNLTSSPSATSVDIFWWNGFFQGEPFLLRRNLPATRPNHWQLFISKQASLTNLEAAVKTLQTNVAVQDLKAELSTKGIQVIVQSWTPSLEEHLMEVTISGLAYLSAVRDVLDFLNSSMVGKDTKKVRRNLNYLVLEIDPEDSADVRRRNKNVIANLGDASPESVDLILVELEKLINRNFAE